MTLGSLRSCVLPFIYVKNPAALAPSFVDVPVQSATEGAPKVWSRPLILVAILMRTKRLLLEGNDLICGLFSHCNGQHVLSVEFLRTRVIWDCLVNGQASSQALHMVSFENFVKSMRPSLSELKVIPSFCFAFKIPDNVTATNEYPVVLRVKNNLHLTSERYLIQLCFDSSHLLIIAMLY